MWGEGGTIISAEIFMFNEVKNEVDQYFDGRDQILQRAPKGWGGGGRNIFGGPNILLQANQNTYWQEHAAIALLPCYILD